MILNHSLFPFRVFLSRATAFRCLSFEHILFVSTNTSGLSLFRKSGTSQTIHKYKLLWFIWVVMFEALFGSHDILILGKSPIKWKRPDMAIAVDWDVK